MVEVIRTPLTTPCKILLLLWISLHANFDGGITYTLFLVRMLYYSYPTSDMYNYLRLSGSIQV